MNLNLPLLKALDARRTKGPWNWRVLSKRIANVQVTAESGGIIDCYGPERLHNAEFVVTLVNSWPAILSRLQAADRLLALVSDLRGVNSTHDMHAALRLLDIEMGRGREVQATDR